MRVARKLALLTVMAFTALAMSATTASANESVIVTNATSNPCNYCAVHIVGESRIALTSNPAVVISRCEDEFDAVIGSLYGSGHITSLTNANHAGGNCTVQQCNGVGESPFEIEWEFSMEETAPNQTELATTFCLESKANPNGTGSHCPADIIVTDVGLYNYRFNLNQACPNGTTIVGQWEAEGWPIKISHLP